MMGLTAISLIVCVAVLGFMVLAALILWQQNRASGEPTLVAPPVPPATFASSEEEVRHWVKQGNKIQAIKVYRQATGVGLKEAKDAVEAFESGAPLAVPGSPLPPASNDLEGEISELLARGSKIEAIKVYREATDAGLKDAKDAVEAFERGEPLSLSTVSTPLPITPGSMDDQVRDLLRQGNKIEAIKVYREATNCGLKEAKDAVEAIERQIL